MYAVVIFFVVLVFMVSLNNQMFLSSIKDVNIMKAQFTPQISHFTKVSQDSNNLNEAFTSVIVIHTSSPTHYQIERYKEWYNSKPENYHVIIITDKCELKNNITTIPIICYTQNEFMKDFPQLKAMTGLCTDKWPGYYMWTSSIEHVIIGIKKENINFKYLWLVEQDLGYTGNLFDFFRKYDRMEFDFIAQNYDNQESNETWMWFDCSTPEYTEWKSNTKISKKRVSGQINIARLSTKLIDSVLFNIKMKRHTFSEATLIENVIINNLTLRLIDKKDFGEICNVFDKIPLKDWIKIQKDPKKKNKLYHALKF